jgi:hypothetical protein
VRQGAASVRARCRADGGQERGLAAQPCAGAVQRRRGISRCTDRSAGGCADRCTATTDRARACGGLDAAEASPRRCASWRSRGRRWRGPLWHAPPSDPAALCRGCSGAERTACRSGMAQMTPRMCKARNGVAHGHRSTEARGMPAGSRPTYGQSYTFEKSEYPLYPFPHNTLSSDYLYISIEYLL